MPNCDGCEKCAGYCANCNRRDEITQPPERKQGCEYCKIDDDFKCSVIHFDGGENGTIDVQMPFNQMEIIYQKGIETMFHLDFEINYCPMCGREFKSEN